MDAQHRIGIKKREMERFSLSFRAFLILLLCFYVRSRKPIYALFHQRIQLRQPCEVSFILEAEALDAGQAFVIGDGDVDVQ